MAGSRARPSSTASASTKRSRRDEGRRAAPRRELALQAAALRDATPPRAVHAGAGRHGAAAPGPHRGQRSGDSRKRGGTSMSALPTLKWNRFEIAFWLIPIAAFFLFPRYLTLGSQ